MWISQNGNNVIRKESCACWGREEEQNRAATRLQPKREGLALKTAGKQDKGKKQSEME